jgi:hypothetical protein
VRAGFLDEMVVTFGVASFRAGLFDRQDEDEVQSSRTDFFDHFGEVFIGANDYSESTFLYGCPDPLTCCPRGSKQHACMSSACRRFRRGERPAMGETIFPALRYVPPGKLPPS